MKTIRFSAICILSIAVVAIACQKQTNSLSVEPSSVVLYSGWTKQLTAQPSEGVTYTSSDEFYAEVDEDGLVTANKVGATTIIASSGNGTVKIPVAVLSQYTLYPDLDQIINTSATEMTEILGSNYTKKVEDGKTTYTYMNYNTYTTGIIAVFENEVCNSIVVLVPSTYATKLAKYLVERYSVVAMQNDIYGMLNHDMDVMIVLGEYNYKYMMVGYAPYSNSKSVVGEISNLLKTYKDIVSLPAD